jgi:DNA-damage-inducible protein J
MAEGYTPQLDVLTDMGNYASNPVPRAYKDSEKKHADAHDSAGPGMARRAHGGATVRLANNVLCSYHWHYKVGTSMIIAAKDAVVRARIDPRLKEQAARVLEAMGLTVSDVLREVMVRVAHDKELPFQVRTALGGMRDVRIGAITEEQFWARKRALQASDHAKAASGTLQPEETLMIPSRMLRGAVPRWPQNAFAECEVPFE